MRNASQAIRRTDRRSRTGRRVPPGQTNRSAVRVSRLKQQEWPQWTTQPIRITRRSLEGRAPSHPRSLVSLNPLPRLRGNQTPSLSACGPAEDLALLIERCYPGVLRFPVRLTGSPDIASDLTQQTFLKALGCRHRLRGSDALVPWVYRIARNNWYSYLRRRRLHKHTSLTCLEERSHTARGSLNQPTTIEQCLVRDTVESALLTLSPVLREALLLRHVHGFSDPEIATLLGISPAAAQRRAHRAEQEFSKQYGRLTNN